MQLDLDFRACSRSCAVTERPLEPGSVYFSVLKLEENDLTRLDYCVDAWTGPPADCVGWWRAQVPPKEDSQPKLAPLDVMLNLFEALADLPAEREFRYLLGLLLLRRRSLRRDDSTLNDEGQEVLTLHCPRREKDYELVVAEPSSEQVVKLQQQMFDLLYASSEVALPAPAANPQAN